MVDYLSRLEQTVHNDESTSTNENFLNEQLLTVAPQLITPWYADIVNYLTCVIISFDFNFHQKNSIPF